MQGERELRPLLLPVHPRLPVWAHSRRSSVAAPRSLPHRPHSLLLLLHTACTVGTHVSTSPRSLPHPHGQHDRFLQRQRRGPVLPGHGRGAQLVFSNLLGWCDPQLVFSSFVVWVVLQSADGVQEFLRLGGWDYTGITQTGAWACAAWAWPRWAEGHL